VAPATTRPDQLIATGPSRQTAAGPVQVQQAVDKPFQQTATRPAKQDDASVSEPKKLPEKKPTGEKKTLKKKVEEPTGKASPGRQEQARPNKQKAGKRAGTGSSSFSELANHVTAADEKQLQQPTATAQPAEDTLQGTVSVG
jgi:hypothetical protein